MRTVAPKTLAWVYVLQVAAGGVAVTLALIGATVVAALVAIVATVAYLWFSTADIEPGVLPKRWVLTVGVSAVLLIGVAVAGDVKAVFEHSYWSLVMPTFWGLSFLGTAIQLTTGRRWSLSKDDAAAG